VLAPSLAAAMVVPALPAWAAGGGVPAFTPLVAVVGSDAPSDLVSVPVPPAGSTTGPDDRDAAAFAGAADPVVEWPVPAEGDVDLPAVGAAADAVPGMPISVAAPDPAAVQDSGAADLVIVDSLADPAVPAGTVVPDPSQSVPATAVPSMRSVLGVSPGDPAPAPATVDEEQRPPGVESTAPPGAQLPASPGSVQVAVLGQATSARLGVSGVVFTVRRSDDGAASGPVSVAFDVSAFAAAYGAEYASRLRVVRFPECALAADPAASPECFQTSQVPAVVGSDGVVTAVLPAAADPATVAAPADSVTPTATTDPSTSPSSSSDTASPEPSAALPTGTASAAAFQRAAAVSPSPSPSASTAGAVPGTGEAVVSPGSSGGASSGVYAVTAMAASSTGGGGTFAATPLAASGEWTHGGNSGAFDYSLPLVLPAATAGSAPGVALSYSSGSVDGMTVASNTQASWVGVGWDYQPGFIERRYITCDDDGHAGYADLCWKKANATLSLGGVSYQLLPDPGDSSGTRWLVRDNPGYSVSLGSGAANDSSTGEFWTVRTPDGTKYWFGRGTGAVTADKTNSTWTVPVFSDDPSDPGYVSTGWTDGLVARQPWRWNLDRITDTNGNITRLYYAAETNRYGKLGNAANALSYERGGRLTRIDYGSQAGAEGTATTTVAGQRVEFTSAYRCTGLTESCAAPTPSTSANYPDIPTDLMCSAAPCSEDGPSFFSTVRLARVKTYAHGSGGWQPVDEYVLRHAFLSPADGIAQLWLDEVQRTGLAVSPSITDRPVVFNGAAMDNRADTGGGSSAAQFYRVTTVYNEIGGKVDVSYGQPDPCSTTPSSWATQTADCYPVYWDPPGAIAPGFGVFHKYVVTSATVTDRVGGSPAQTTTYSYTGGGAWHHNDDPFAPDATVTWDQWRGYETVKAVTGAGADRTVVKTRYYRGMDGDKLTGSTVKSVSVTDADGTTSTTDHDLLSGRVREVQTFDSANAELTGEKTTYTRIVQQAKSGSWPFSGQPEIAMVRAQTVKSRQTISTGTRTHTVFTDYDTYGMADLIVDYGVDEDSTDTVCTDLAYTRNDTAWIVDRVRSVYTYNAFTSPSCSGALVARTATYYDGATTTTATPGPTGNATAADTYLTGGTFTRSTTSYDGLGRVTRTNDWVGTSDPTTFSTARTADLWRTTDTSYTAAYDQDYPVTIRTTTDLGQVSTTRTDGTRGLVESTRKATSNSGADPTTAYLTTTAYDALGRITAVTLPTSALPAVKFTYTPFAATPATAPNRVQTQTLYGDTGATTYRSGYAYYDGLGRVRETQALPTGDAVVTKRIITATRYTDTGAVPAALNDSTDVPGSGFVNPAASSVPSETRYSYDELGRTTATDTYGLGVKKFGTTTTYYGERSTTVLPRADTTGYGNVTTYTDILGATTKISEALPSGVHSVDYTYDSARRLFSVATKASASASTTTSTRTYDLAGRLLTTFDQDAGTTTYTYDRGSRQTSASVARGATTLRTVSTGYDTLARPTQSDATATSTAGAPVTTSKWTYDKDGAADAPGVLTTASSTASYSTTAANYDVAASKTADLTYTTTYSGFDALQRPTTTTYTVPGNEGVLAGTYAFTSAWYLDGALKSATSPAVGPLPAETLVYSYDTAGYLSAVRGTYSAEGTTYDTDYLASVGHESYGALKTLNLGSTGTATNTTQTATVAYTRADAATRRLSGLKITQPAPAANTVLDQTIAYDHSGLPTTISDAASRTTGSATVVAQRECFRYDSQQRLTAYFTQPNGTACPATTTTDSAAVAGATITPATGGPDGYAALYTVDDLGQLTQTDERRINATGGVWTATTAIARTDPVIKHAPTGTTRTDAGGATMGTQAFTYDAGGRNITRTVGTNSHTPGDTANASTSALSWDGNGRLLSSLETNTTTGKSRAVGYIYDPSGQLIARHDDDAADDAATGTPTIPTGQRTLWLGTGGSQGTSATGLAGTGGLQIQIHRSKTAGPADPGTAATNVADQRVTVSRAILASTGAGGQVQQIASHTATGAVAKPALPTTAVAGRVWWTLGDARGQLAATGTTTITIPANPTSSDPASATTWSAGVAGFRRTTPYGLDRTALNNPAPASTTTGATAAYRTGQGLAGPGGLAAAGFLGAADDTIGAEDSATLPGQTPATGSGYASTGLTLLGARPYDPVTGSFVQPDPVSIPSDPSDAGSYAYVHGKALTDADPTGLVAAGSEGTRRDPIFSKAEYERRQTNGSTGKPISPQDVWNVFAGAADGAFTAVPLFLAQCADRGNPATTGAFELGLEAIRGQLREHGGASTEGRAYQESYTLGHWGTGIATLFIPLGIIGRLGKAAEPVEAAANSGNRVFWSGGQPAKEAAEAFAKANGSKTLEMTAVGRTLEKLPYNRFTAKLWDAASAGFAATARGNANVFIGPSFRGAGSTFGRIEGPILRFKGNPILQRFEDVW
jgi:RHS repeat-associated protein